MNHKRGIANNRWKRGGISNSSSISSNNESSSWWYPLLHFWSTLKGLGKALCRYSGINTCCSGCLHFAIYSWAALKEIGKAFCRYSGIKAFCSICLRFARPFFKRLQGGLAVYCRKGCITGTRYLVAKNYHYTERIFWAICLLFSILLGLAVIREYLNTYTDNVFRVVVEDRDTNKPIHFPPAGICELSNEAIDNEQLLRIYENITAPYPLFEGEFDIKLFNVLRLMVYQETHGGSQLRDLLNSTHIDIYTEILEGIDFEKMAKEVRASCKELMLECTWLGKRFDCCTYFRAIKTMMGVCYLMNSWQTINGPFLNLSITKTQEKPSLSISFRRNANVRLLNPTEVPEKLTPEFNYDIYELTLAHIDFVHRPMVTDVELFAYNLNVTNCYEGNERYMDWNRMVNFTYKYASHTACWNDCIRNMQYDACGCISYVFNKGDVNYCNLEGYLCLEENSVFTVHGIHELKNRTCQQCLQACNSDANTMINFDRKFTSGSPRSVIFTLLSFPLKQFHRQVIRGDLDVLVSLGGILSLFIGISVVGMLEFLFIVIRAMIYPQREQQ